MATRNERNTLQINCTKNISTQFDFAIGIALKYNQRYFEERSKIKYKKQSIILLIYSFIKGLMIDKFHKLCINYTQIRQMKDFN